MRDAAPCKIALLRAASNGFRRVFFRDELQRPRRAHGDTNWPSGVSTVSRKWAKQTDEAGHLVGRA
jgi:hypothetical protein